jgi:hypothetical protein
VPERCPDCFGEGKALGRSTKLEWRLRAMEKAYQTAEAETKSDVLWLIGEIRHAREALVRVLARCADGSGGDGGDGVVGVDQTAVKDAMYIANEALGLYEPRT